jgi:hypothetical protein
VAKGIEFTEPFAPRHPWVAALLLGTAVTPAGVVLAWLAPRPLDAVVALPLVLLDIWATPGAAASVTERPLAEAPFARLVLLTLGITLTWLLYVIAARLILWRLVPRSDGTMRD